MTKHRRTIFAVLIGSLFACIVPASHANERERETLEQIAKAIGTTLMQMSNRWRPEDICPYFHPNYTKGVLQNSLNRGAAGLGALKKCDGGKFDDQDSPIKNAVKYSDVCDFEHGRAKIFILFGSHPEEGIVLFALDVFPLPH